MSLVSLIIIHLFITKKDQSKTKDFLSKLRNGMSLIFQLKAQQVHLTTNRREKWSI